MADTFYKWINILCISFLKKFAPFIAFKKQQVYFSAKSNPMKARCIPLIFVFWILLLFFPNASFAQPQGKVVINEYMPWTSNTCGVKTEFVELLNFGPGPVNIGCYILTTGVYSVTIPPNTILKAGEMYILAGQNFIPGTCGNVDSTASGITANLNWNTCNCTNVPIPSTNSSAGFMADNGYSPLVLLDPSLNVIDAIIRGLPGNATGPVTSSSVNGGCTSKTFNIGTMSIQYEELGMAPGSQNSYARTVDGDCVWLKQPSQSGNASNTRKGNTTDISYEFDMVKPTSCEESGYGSVSIYVKHSNYAAIFPMSYTISLDVNNDGIFDFADQYTTFTDVEPPFIEIDNLPVGRFKVTVYSIKGCYLRTFDFPIIPCEPNTLPVRLLYFKNSGTRQNQHHLEWLLQEAQNLQSIVLEKSTDGKNFIAEKIFTGEGFRGGRLFSYPAGASASFRYYRLKITQKSGKPFYSPVVTMGVGEKTPPVRIFPNPATNKLQLQLSSPRPQKVAYAIYNTSGLALQSGHLLLSGAEQIQTISLQHLPPGTYQLQVSGIAGEPQPISLRFVKH